MIQQDPAFRSLSEEELILVNGGLTTEEVAAIERMIQSHPRGISATEAETIAQQVARNSGVNRTAMIAQAGIGTIVGFGANAAGEVGYERIHHHQP